MVKALTLVEQQQRFFDKRLKERTGIILSEDILLKASWGRSDEHELCKRIGSLSFYYDYHFKRFSIGIGGETLMLPNIKYAHQVRVLITILTGNTKNPDFTDIVNPHYDSEGRLEGGSIYVDGVYIGHADPHGAKGTLGEAGAS